MVRLWEKQLQMTSEFEKGNTYKKKLELDSYNQSSFDLQRYYNNIECPDIFWVHTGAFLLKYIATSQKGYNKFGIIVLQGQSESWDYLWISYL